MSHIVIMQPTPKGWEAKTFSHDYSGIEKAFQLLLTQSSAVNLAKPEVRKVFINELRNLRRAIKEYIDYDLDISDGRFEQLYKWSRWAVRKIENVS